MRRMRLRMKAGILLIIVAMLAGCMNTANETPTTDNGSNTQSNVESRGMRVHNDGSDGHMLSSESQDAVLQMVQYDGQLYVPLQQLADTLSFQSEWADDGSSFNVGDNDVAYEIVVHTQEARRGGEAIQLSQPSIVREGAVYVPYDSLQSLFGDAMNFDRRNQELLIHPSVDDLINDAGVPDFRDDPNDPGSDAGQVSASGDLPVMLNAAKVDVDKLLGTAKKYIGVEYDFGAAPYPKSGKFDCSTFTQYVYGKYDITLPRLSRQQGKVGTPVSRTSLRKGDLLFFYLPGRFKSNDIIGHVGIYMGNGQMIHSSTKPKDGVQITSINKSFWKKTYLSARRVI